MPSRTKLSAIADSVVESGWLVTLLVVPVYFNAYTERIFEGEKALLLRALATLVASAMVVRAVGNGSRAARIDTFRMWRVPLCFALLGLTAVYVISSLLSIDPAVSWWGGYDRNHGAATWLALVVIFFAGAAGSRTSEQVERAIDCLLTGSVAVSAYALAQALDLDPISWQRQVSIGRPASSAGNPIFAAAFLTGVFPLALARTLTAVESAGWSRALPYLGVTVLQGMAIGVTQSRGPSLALAAGLLVFLLLLIRLQRTRALRATAIVVAITAAFAALAALRGVDSERASEQRAIRPSTATTRTIIWSGVADLVESNPSRVAFGSGPETLFVAFAPYYPAVLGKYEKRDASPDRSHNQTLDALAMTGITGCVAELALFFTLFHLILRRLSLLDASSTRGFALSSVAGGMVGLILPLAVDGSLRFAGLGIPVGAAGGLTIFLALRSAAAVSPDKNALIHAGLLACALTHFAEIQVGIAVVMTKLCFLACAAFALTLSGSNDSDVVEASHNAPRRSVLYGTYSAILLIALTFGFYTPTTDLSAVSSGLATVLLSVSIFGATRATSRQESTARALLQYGATSLGLWAAFVSVYKPWIDWSPANGPATVEAVGNQLAGAAEIFYVSVVLWIGFHASSLVAWRRAGTGTVARAPAVLSLAAGAAATVVAFHSSLAATRADVFSKLGGILQRAGNPVMAQQAHEEAYQLASAQGRYAINLGQSLVERARTRTVDEASATRADLERAESVLMRAASAHPLDPDYPTNLARLYRYWATRAAAGERDSYLDRSEHAYRAALALRPQGVLLWNEVATMYAQRGHSDEMTAAFDRSLELDGRNSETFWTRAEVAYANGELESALQDYTRASDIRPSSIEAWSGKSAALARLGRFDESIEAALKALEVEPDDSVTHRNLARLYRATGDVPSALAHAEAALRTVEPDQRQRVIGLIHELRNLGEGADRGQSTP